jgi:hypothetical protein
MSPKLLFLKLHHDIEINLRFDPLIFIFIFFVYKKFKKKKKKFFLIFLFLNNK